MIERQSNNRMKPAVVDRDSLVPRFHMLRKIERSMDRNAVYSLVEQRYSKNAGRLSINPVVLIIYDCVLCSQCKALNYSTTNRKGYGEYKRKPYICKSFPVRKQCTQSETG